ncbi:hypothetical protein PMAYCL1PPCAC_32260, partial [Pristionchus mayeri]
ASPSCSTSNWSAVTPSSMTAIARLFSAVGTSADIALSSCFDEKREVTSESISGVNSLSFPRTIIARTMYVKLENMDSRM